MTNSEFRATLKKEDFNIIAQDMEELGLSQNKFLLLLELIAKTSLNLKLNEKIPIRRIDEWLWSGNMFINTKKNFGLATERESVIISEISNDIRRKIQEINERRKGHE